MLDQLATVYYVICKPPLYIWLFGKRYLYIWYISNVALKLRNFVTLCVRTGCCNAASVSSFWTTSSNWWYGSHFTACRIVRDAQIIKLLRLVAVTVWIYFSISIVDLIDYVFCTFLLLTDFNTLIATLIPQSSRPSYSSTVIGTLPVDGWAVTFGTVRRGLGGAAVRPGPFLLYQM